MKKMRWIGALSLVLSVNIVVLAGVAWNRSGPPEASLTLTERELPLTYSRSRAEDSGVALTLRWTEEAHWFDEAKLRSLGFDPAACRTSDRSERKRALPRSGYVVLEFDGPAWQAALRREEDGLASLRADLEAGKDVEQELKEAEEDLQRMRRSASRLVSVDAGLDPESLRARYPDRSKYLITQAELVMSRCYKADCQPTGFVRRIATREIHVPARHHALIQGTLGDEPDDNRSWRPYHEGEPRYRVRLQYGKRHEPRVADFEPVEHDSARRR